MNVHVGNSGNAGRWASALGGGALLALAARRRSPLSIPLALGGAALVWRGLTGRSVRTGGREEPGVSSEVGEVDPAEAIDRGTRREREEREKDIVDEASEESFPASDPPSFTPASIG